MTTTSIPAVVPYILPYHSLLKLEDYKLEPFDLMVWFQLGHRDRLHEFLDNHPSDLSPVSRHLFKREASVRINKELDGSGEAITVALDGARKHHQEVRSVALSLPLAVREVRGYRSATRAQHGPAYYVAKGLHSFLSRAEEERGQIKEIYLMPQESDVSLATALEHELRLLGHDLQKVD